MGPLTETGPLGVRVVGVPCLAECFVTALIAQQGRNTSELAPTQHRPTAVVIVRGRLQNPFIATRTPYVLPLTETGPHGVRVVGVPCLAECFVTELIAQQGRNTSELAPTQHRPTVVVIVRGRLQNPFIATRTPYVLPLTETGPLGVRVVGVPCLAECFVTALTAEQGRNTSELAPTQHRPTAVV